MRDTRARRDSLWRSSCLAYHLQIPIVGTVAGRCRALQAVAAKAAAKRLYIVPARSLHVSLYTLIGVRDSLTVHQKRELWTKMSVQLPRLRRHCQSVEPEELGFSKVSVSDTAVMLVAEPNRLVSELRSFVESDWIPREAEKRDYNQIHVTIARYRSPEIDLDELVEQLRASWEGCVYLTVERLRVMEERTYPSLLCREIDRIPIGKRRI